MGHFSEVVQKWREKQSGVKASAGTFGIRRIDMPQVASVEALASYLKNKHNISSKPFIAPAKDLKMTQIEFNPEKVNGIKKQVAADKNWTANVLTSSDNFVLDGTHRFLGAYNHDPEYEIDGIQFDCPMKDLLPIVQQWDGADFKGVNESVDSGIVRYKKIPVEVDTMTYTGDNQAAILDWVDGSKIEDDELVIPTLEDGKNNIAKHVASIGDIIVKGVDGEFYPVKPDIFKKTYESINNESK